MTGFKTTLLIPRRSVTPIECSTSGNRILKQDMVLKPSYRILNLAFKTNFEPEKAGFKIISKLDKMLSKPSVKVLESSGPSDA